MTAAKNVRASLGDTYAEWAVIVVLLIALAIGWGIKAATENQMLPYTANGLTISYPSDWSASTTAEGVLRFRDVRAGGVPPVIEVRAIDAADAAVITQTLALEADSLALTRAQELTAYRILEMDDTVAFRGQAALRVSFVYVMDEPSAFEQHLPVVVLGEDWLTWQQGKILVFSRQAPQDAFDKTGPYFQRVMDSFGLAR